MNNLMYTESLGVMIMVLLVASQGILRTDGKMLHLGLGFMLLIPCITVSVCSSWLGLPIVIGGLFGFLSGAVTSAIVFVTLRQVNSVLWALGTLAFQVVISGMLEVYSVFEGTTTVPTLRSLIENWDGGVRSSVAIACLLAVTLALWFHQTLSRSFGYKLFQASGDTQLGLENIDLSVDKIKCFGLVYASLFSSLAGVILSLQTSTISLLSFGYEYAIVILAASVIGGERIVYGSIIGALIYSLTPFVLELVNINSSDQIYLRNLIFPIILLVVVMRFPKGIAHYVRFDGMSKWIRWK